MARLHINAARLALVALVMVAAAGCRKDIKPDLPDGPAVAPTIVYVDRVRYVAIPANLTAEQPIAEGALTVCPDVASERKGALRKVNAQLREIRAIQGTAVKP